MPLQLPRILPDNPVLTPFVFLIIFFNIFYFITFGLLEIGGWKSGLFIGSINFALTHYFSVLSRNVIPRPRSPEKNPADEEVVEGIFNVMAGGHEFNRDGKRFGQSANNLEALHLIMNSVRLKDEKVWDAVSRRAEEVGGLLSDELEDAGYASS